MIDNDSVYRGAKNMFKLRLLDNNWQSYQSYLLNGFILRKKSKLKYILI